MPKFSDVVYGVTPEISSKGKELVTAEWVLFKAKGIMPDKLIINALFTTVSEDKSEATIDLSKSTQIADWGTPETFFTTYKGIELLFDENLAPNCEIPADGGTTKFHFLEGEITLSRAGNVLTFSAVYLFNDSDGSPIKYPLFNKIVNSVVWWKTIPEPEE